MDETRFVYVTYIAAPPQRVWDALLEPEFTRRYWEHDNVSDWKVGSRWEHRESSGARSLQMTGEVLESDPPRRLVLTWVDPAGGPGSRSRVAIDIEPLDGMVRLTVTHDQLVPGSEVERKIMAGWPRVISSLKSLLETGKPLPTWARAKA